MMPADAQPRSAASTSAPATRPTASARSAAPSRSGRLPRVSSRLSGTRRRASTIATIPTGRFTQKTQRQPTSTRPPPITGPRAAPRAPSADQDPSARARCSCGTTASSSDSDAGTITPAPTACTVLAATSQPTPGARPQSSDPPVNTASPATKARRRPTRSPHRPAGISTAANTIVYALRIHDSAPRSAPANSSPIEGNARLTMNRSRLDMNTAMANTATTAAVPPFGSGPVMTDDGDRLPSPMNNPQGQFGFWTYGSPAGWVRPDIGLSALGSRHGRTGGTPRLLHRAHARRGGREV